MSKASRQAKRAERQAKRAERKAWRQENPGFAQRLLFGKDIAAEKELEANLAIEQQKAQQLGDVEKLEAMLKFSPEYKAQQNTTIMYGLFFVGLIIVGIIVWKKFL